MASLLLLALFGTALVLPTVVFGVEDYCNPKLCRSGKHVACADPGFQSTCAADSSPVQVDLSGELQQLIVQEHNNYRSQIALGQIPGYKTAAKMLEIKWDSDLAYVAGFNARSCVMKHDTCRSTTKYPYSGQNLAYVASTGKYLEDKASIRQMIGNWFKEYPNTNMTIIDKFQSVAGPQYGHFTALVQQKSGNVGCGLVRYKDGKWLSTLLACNYEYTNMIGDSIYTSGVPCSACKVRCSSAATGLCAA